MLPDLFRKLKPLYGTAIDLLWIEYQTADVERKREIEEYLTLLGVKKLGLAVGDEKLVLDAPPAALIGDGEFTIGMVSYPSIPPYPFRVRRNELLRHLFILGPTGTASRRSCSTSCCRFRLLGFRSWCSTSNATTGVCCVHRGVNRWSCSLLDARPRHSPSTRSDRRPAWSSRSGPRRCRTSSARATSSYRAHAT